ncbi:LuxR C-terminal-related transcriptional regulator [Candidatus Thiodictyon syntrophicum]|jgi:DNA-binding NarL/FixJ family response regulator|uniref:DNA-binding response regulator n=1 Tax=Candidatus Thiodictyon syntrophicum TaxID=1166950 RepID=A0A2K8UDL5_9GAMM|nr:response regulator transcription factor [Candidatus Thiodictyon syntrophicum]AUB83605.1 DNA-binding response regulator [Candidatus Thiodictyon syntrophicum]
MSTTIILAEFQAMVRQGLVALFQREEDVSVLGQAADGDTAWQLIVQYHPAVAILDIALSGIHGIGLARRIEEAALNTRVVLLTMNSDPRAVLEAEQAGVAGYVLKNSTFEELSLALRTVAGGGTFMTPAVRRSLRDLQRNGQPAGTLTPRERTILRLIAHGKSSKEIARVLEISPRTVDTHRNRLMNKLDLHSVANVVRWAVLEGLAV